MLNRSFENREAKAGTPWYLLQPDQMDKYSNHAPRPSDHVLTVVAAGESVCQTLY